MVTTASASRRLGAGARADGAIPADAIIGSMSALRGDPVFELVDGVLRDLGSGEPMFVGRRPEVGESATVVIQTGEEGRYRLAVPDAGSRARSRRLSPRHRCISATSLGSRYRVARCTVMRWSATLRARRPGGCVRTVPGAVGSASTSSTSGLRAPTAMSRSWARPWSSASPFAASRAGWEHTDAASRYGSGYPGP